MARTLSAKTRVIREAIAANPGKKPRAIADLINSAEARKEDKIEVKAADVNNQVQTLKNQKLTRPKASKPAATAESAPQPAPAKEKPAKITGHAELIDRLFDIASEVGGFDQLKRMVDRIANSQ